MHSLRRAACRRLLVRPVPVSVRSRVSIASSHTHYRVLSRTVPRAFLQTRWNSDDATTRRDADAAAAAGATTTATTTTTTTTTKSTAATDAEPASDIEVESEKVEEVVSQESEGHDASATNTTTTSTGAEPAATDTEASAVEVESVKIEEVVYRDPEGSANSTATTDATATTTASTDAEPASVVEIRNEKTEEVVSQDQEVLHATTNTDTTTTTTTTTTILSDTEPVAEVKIQSEQSRDVLDQNTEVSLETGATTTNTTTAATSAKDDTSSSYYDALEQIREAADQEPATGQNAYDEEEPEKKSMLSRDRFLPKETIYIGNLFYDVTAEDLRTQMSKYGVVEDVSIIFDSRGISKGYGYVTFDTVESATRAIRAMHMRIFEGRPCVVSYASASLADSKTLSPATNTLYIGNLPFNITDRDLNDLFKDVLNVIDVRVNVDRRTGLPRGFCHAEFINTASARDGLEVLSRKRPQGRKLRINFAVSNKKTFPVAQ